jgi:hypothetical protein
VTEPAKFFWGQILGENISKLVVGADVLDRNFFILLELSNLVKGNVDMFASFVELRIHHETNGYLIVRKMGCWFRLRKSHIYHKSSGPDSLFGSNRCRDILTFSSTGSNALLLAAEPNDRAFIEHYYTTRSPP